MRLLLMPVTNVGPMKIGEDTLVRFHPSLSVKKTGIEAGNVGDHLVTMYQQALSQGLAGGLKQFSIQVTILPEKPRAN